MPALDHVNLRIPESRIDEAVEFYDEILGFDLENMDRYESGAKPFFSFRIGPTAVVHVQPTASFASPTGAAFDHVAICMETPIDEIRSRLETNGVPIDREFEPLGATGVGPAVYVTDPFGYTVEIKSC